SIGELVSWISKVGEKMNIDYEAIIVDDGSTDKSWETLIELKQKFSFVKGIRFRRNYGKSAALNTGFNAASGDVVITMDADLQDSPEEIPDLYKMIKEDNYDLVSGWKKKRHDPLSKRIPSKLFNRTTRWLSGIKLNDFNCGLKAYSLDLVKSIEVYGEMHRYIPVIAKNAGFDKIGEKVVQHQARKYGVTKFGLERVLRGYLDLMSISFMTKFGKRPMHFFGGIGTLLSLVGILVLTYLSISKLFFDVPGISQRPLFYLGMLSIIIGVQLFIAGFLAEMISRNTPNRNEYSIKETI
ncbi:MAG: glycosyltransferase family 2 protein, partial [Saprospiraceae bacterium]|nr:glycosyltransferase family 2 protein [Bacteroidia bacterium]NNL93562.1 glycosyltransferase family 2 protein [Saprospiraceae bacterium]